MTTHRHDDPSPAHLSPANSSSNQPSSPASHESEVAALQQELAMLRAAHEQELSALRAEMSTQVVMLRTALTTSQFQHGATPLPQPSSPNASASSDAVVEEPRQQPNEQNHEHADGATSRRTLLKWGGVGAAAALAAAGGATLTMPTAHAADNANLVLGSATNTAEHLTVLSYDGSETAPTVFQATTTADDSAGIIGAVGNATSGSAYGVYGVAGTGIGANGIVGLAGTDGTGIQGQGTGASSVGVYGSTDSGYGVVGSSTTGIDIAAGFSGRLLQALSGSVGAPTSGAYQIGEQIRDNNGDLYICIEDGSPGTWQKVLTVVPGNTGVISLLSAPIRLLDTRTNHTTWPSGSIHTLQVTGVLVGSIQVPNGAIGVVGNVTVVQPNGAGDLRLYPGGASLPSTSSINFASGQIIANGVIVGLDTNGQMNIKVDMPANTATNVIFDASGYIM